MRLPFLHLFARAATRALKFADARRAHGSAAIMLDPLFRAAKFHVPRRGGAISLHAFVRDLDELVKEATP